MHVNYLWNSYGDVRYWNDMRYASEGGSYFYDWYAEWNDLKTILFKVCPPAYDDSERKALVLGTI